MKVVVTGGAGYVGAPVVEELLSGGHHVTVLDALAREETPFRHARPGLDYHQADLRAAPGLGERLRGADAVVHLAALVIVRKLKDDAERALLRSINEEATKRLVDAARAAGVARFLFASTCSVYEPHDPSRPASESAPVKATNEYTEGKIAMEKYVLGSGDRDFAPVVVRFATVYGASARLNFEPLPNSWLREALTKKRLEVYGPDSWRPYVHTRDAARAVRLLIEAPLDAVHGQVYNVGSNAQNVTKRAIASELQRLVPGLEVHVNEAQADPRNYFVDFSKIARLGFVPREDLAHGLSELERIIRAQITV